MVRAEHRSAIPGIVHGGSTSGASLFVEPLETVEINNEIVALEEQELEEVRRILLAADGRLPRTARRARTDDRSGNGARCDSGPRTLLADDRLVEPIVAADGTLELRAARIRC
jgi:DNA mismatch repair protein MutS2